MKVLNVGGPTRPIIPSGVGAIHYAAHRTPCLRPPPLLNHGERGGSSRRVRQTRVFIFRTSDLCTGNRSTADAHTLKTTFATLSHRPQMGGEETRASLHPTVYKIQPGLGGDAFSLSPRAKLRIGGLYMMASDLLGGVIHAFFSWFIRSFPPHSPSRTYLSDWKKV